MKCLRKFISVMLAISIALCSNIICTAAVADNIIISVDSEANTITSPYVSSFDNLAILSDYHEYAGIMVGGNNSGISANIKTPRWLPDVSDSGESVWVSTNIDANGEWIQAGARYYSHYENGFRTYVEHYQSGIYNMSEIGYQVLDFAVTYKVEYSTSDKKWHAYIAGVEKASSTLSTSLIGVQAQAEIHKEGIEMGPFTFSNVQIKNSSSTWKNNTTSPTANYPYQATGSPTEFTVSGP